MYMMTKAMRVMTRLIYLTMTCMKVFASSFSCVMQYSTAVRQKVWDEIRKDMPSDAPALSGTGKLYGATILCAANEGEPCDTLETRLGNKSVILDREYGFMIGKEDHS